MSSARAAQSAGVGLQPRPGWRSPRSPGHTSLGSIMHIPSFFSLESQATSPWGDRATEGGSFFLHVVPKDRDI